jgi:hypothetical protein
MKSRKDAGHIGSTVSSRRAVGFVRWSPAVTGVDVYVDASFGAVERPP